MSTLANAKSSIGDDLLRWAGLVDDEGDAIATIEQIEEFAEILQHSSIPEACALIRQGALERTTEQSLALATKAQRAAYERLRRRCGIRGVVFLSDGNLSVGFEALNGRDREAVIGPDGRRVETRNTYSYRR